MKRIRIPAKKTALYALLLASMVLLNFALPQREPLSFALYEAALFCGLDPFLLSAFYLLSSVTALSLFAALSAAVQAAAADLCIMAEEGGELFLTAPFNAPT